MEDTTATAIEVEAGVEVEALNIDTSARHHGMPESCSSSPIRIGEDECASAASDASAAPGKQKYTTVANETTPLLAKYERMSAQLQSPIEIVGIEGADGADRPWLRASETKQTPWWETPSVSVAQP